MVLDDTSMNWFRLRERRSSLQTQSKLDRSAARRQAFSAAMGQFEEEFAAAKIVTAATRPLNLYYGLAQAGMAIAAAHADDPWSFDSHGLKLVDRHVGLADMTVKTEGDGAFQKVAAATGSPGIAEPVSLGALWASLPDLGYAGLLPGESRPVPLEISADEFPARRPRATLFLAGEMFADGQAFLPRLGEIMADYPSAEGYAIPADELNAIQPPAVAGHKWQVTLRWPALDSREMSEGEINAFFDEIAPEYRYCADRFLRPAIGKAKSAPPSPLMTWWLLLHGFSILARYEPGRWAKLLDLDKPGRRCCSTRWRRRSPRCRTWCSRRSTGNAARCPSPWRSRNPIGGPHVIDPR